MTQNDDRDSRGAGFSDDLAAVVHTVDARELSCPLPLLRAKQGLNRIKAGERIMVLATDGGSVRDFHSFARLTNTRICHFCEADGVFTYILEKP